MPKPNLLTLPVPIRRRETKTFTDPLQPQRDEKTGEILRDGDGKSLLVPFTFTCEGPGAVEAGKFADKDDEFQKKFITGDKDAAPPYAASRLPLVDKSSLQVSPGMAQIFALAETIQCPESADDRYSTPDLGLLTKVAPNAYRDLSAWLLDLYRNPYVMPERRDAEGNASGPPPTT